MQTTKAYPKESSVRGKGSAPGCVPKLLLGNAAHSSILAWEIPWTEEPGRLQSMGSQSQTQLSTQQLHCSYPKKPDKAENAGGCTKGWTREMNASQLSSLLLFPVVYRLLFTIELILKHILPTPQFLISGYLINYY